MKEFNDAMLDLAWNNLNSENNRFKDIDTKAIGLITITGVLMAFLTKTVSIDSISSILLLLVAVAFFTTIFYSIRAIKIREMDALSSKILIDTLRNENPTRQISGIIGTIAETEKNVRDTCNSKAADLEYAVRALGFGVAVLILYTVLNFLYPFF
jgi:hypothetical protein